MKIIKSILGALLVLPVLSFAQTVSLEETSCFNEGLYEFQSVEVNVGPERYNYIPGDTVSFLGEITNHNKYSVVDGDLFVRISRVNDDYMIEGHNIVDEFVAIPNVSLNGSSTKSVDFVWEVPTGSGTDQYRADYFFSVGDRFNLGGLPFTNEILAGYSRFSVNEGEVSFYFDKGETKVNGEKYFHIGDWPQIDSDESVVITQPLINPTDEDVSVKVTYDHFYWDSRNDDDLIESKSENVVIPANSSVDTAYVIEENVNAVSYVRITAESEGVKSIVNVRTISDDSKVRFNYPAINNFPLTEGEEVDVFSCFHMTGGNLEEEEISVSLALTDSRGKTVFEGEYMGSVTGEMSAVKAQFVAAKDYSYLKLNAELTDSEGNLIEIYESEYSCNDLGGEKCFEITNGNYVKNILGNTVIVLLSLFAVAFTLEKIFKHPKFKRSIRVLSVLIALITLVTAILAMFNRPEYVEAQNFSDGQPITQSDSDSDSWVWGWEEPNGRRVAAGSITHAVTGTLTTDTGETQIFVGDGLNVAIGDECTHNAHASNWDTPYCSQNDNFSAGGNDGYIKWTPIVYNDVDEITSSNESVLTCNGTSCTAVAPGTATITYYQTKVNAYADGCVEVQGGLVCEDSSVLAHNRQLRLSKNNSHDTTTFTERSKVLGPFTFSWDITVVDDGYEALTLSCDRSGSSSQNIPTTVTWTANASGGEGGYTYSWSGQSGDEDGDNTDNTFVKTFNSQGNEGIDVTVVSGPFNKTVSCPSVFVRDPDAPVDGRCNPDIQGKSLSEEPQISELCAAGSASDFGLNEGGDGWEWTCEGFNSEVDESCWADYSGGFTVVEVDITPDVVPALSDECLISWNVIGSSEYTCEVITELRDVYSVDGGDNSEGVAPGNKYIVKCDGLSDGIPVTDESELLNCVFNPNFQEI